MSQPPAGGATASRTVLVVEDDAHVAALLRFLLDDAGYAVTHAPDGRSGLLLASSERPDVIVMDLLLPYVDGFTMLARLRAAEPTADIPVLVLSGRSGGDDVAAARRAGASDCLTKPFDPEVLLARIADLLSPAAVAPVEAP